MTAIASQADLEVTKSDETASVFSGDTTSYTLTLTNNGPASANGTTIRDQAAAGLTKAPITDCTASNGAVCPTIGTGAGQLSIANLEAGTVVVPTMPSGGYISITVTASVTATSGTVTNTFSATPPTGITDPTPANNTASDTDTVSVLTCNSAFTAWTFNNTLTPSTGNGTISFGTVTSSYYNGGTTPPALSTTGWPRGSSNASYVQFAVPTTGLTNIGMNFREANSGSTPTTFMVYYNADYRNNNTWIRLGTTTYTITSTWATITLDFSSVTALNNDAYAGIRLLAYGGGGAHIWYLDNVNFTGCPSADMSVTKNDNKTSVIVGGTTTYTIRATNYGPSSVTGAILSDPDVAGLSKTAVTCSAALNNQCVTPPTIAQLEGGAFPLPVLTINQFYEITVTANVTASSGNVTNTATINTPAGTIDPTSSNDTASDTDAVLALPTITKAFAVTNLASGGNTNLTLTIGNSNPSAITLTSALTDILPSGMTIRIAGNAGTCSGVTANAAAGSFTMANGNVHPRRRLHGDRERHQQHGRCSR